LCLVNPLGFLCCIWLTTRAIRLVATRLTAILSYLLSFDETKRLDRLVKGIILAGGAGSRLYPATLGACKQLLPVYDKPMIYYPLSVLMLSGIRDILIISTPQDTPSFERMLGDGSSLGLSVSYVVQERPRGLADAFLVGKSFLGNSPVTLILGDNIFFGSGLGNLLRESSMANKGATIFGYRVDRPEAYGVAKFDACGRVVEIVEKPVKPPSNIAVTGIYIYDNSVSARAEQLHPSPRGEIEISDLNNTYIEDGLLDLVTFPRGFAWLDTGTHESLMEAGQFVRAVEVRQGLKIGCIEELAFNQGWITGNELERLGQKLSKTAYGEYLLRLTR
jgi:glucose-1-phosphate thymidylyltransferase